MFKKVATMEDVEKKLEDVSKEMDNIMKKAEEDLLNSLNIKTKEKTFAKGFFNFNKNKAW